MKKKSLPIIFLLLFSGLFSFIALVNPPDAHAIPSVAFSNQAGVSPASSGSTVANIKVQTTGGSTQIVIVWVIVKGSIFNAPSNVFDNQSNAWTLNTIVTNVGCPNRGGSCAYGAMISNQVVDTGHDSISIIFPGFGYYISLAAYDVAGGTVIFDNKQSSQDVNVNTNLAVPSYTPTANALVLTEAFINSNTGTLSAGAGYTLASGQSQYPLGSYWASSEYQISAGATTSPETSTANLGWFEASMAFDVVTAVIQPINIATANYAPVVPLQIRGCGVSNSSFNPDGYKHTYSALVPSCILTISINFGFDTATTRYCFNDAGTCTLHYFVTTPPAGTGATATNTTYYQLNNQYQMLPYNPIVWDQSYSEPVLGTFLGTASSTIVTMQLFFGTSIAQATAWSDYGQVVTFPAMFVSTNGCGGTWTNSSRNIATVLNPSPPQYLFTTYILSASICTTTIISTSTIVGVNSPSAANFGAAIGPEIIPLFFLAFGMIIVGAFRIRGDFGVTVMLGAFFVGNLFGMLSNGGITKVGVIPLGLTVESAVFFVMWVLAGGATSSR